MEAVPRLPMLSFKQKSVAEPADFSAHFRQHIWTAYQEDPDLYSQEFRDFEALRASACQPFRDFSGCAVMKKYYCQLHMLQNRFPFKQDEKQGMVFTWRDAYSNTKHSSADIRYEMACILYNVGALHSELGTVDARTSPEGMKISCTHFQCAAWAFQEILECFPGVRSLDLSSSLLKLLSQICLAQAQECILEKSMSDGRKPSLVAKLAAQVTEYYKAVLQQLDNSKGDDNVSDIVGSKNFKSWRRYCDFKCSFYRCVALLYQGLEAEEGQRMGERVAFFQAAQDNLSEAQRLGKHLEDSWSAILGEALTFTEDVVGGKLRAALKENEFVYHEKVPEKSSLSEIKGASLVKGIGFNVTDPEVAGQDIFARLVPIEAHEASSFYSEEKASLLRRVLVNVEEKDQELAVFLTSLHVDQLVLHQNQDQLPQVLIDACAAMSVEPEGVQGLIKAMSRLSSLYYDVESQLKEVEELFEMDESEEATAKALVPHNQATMMLMANLRREFARYKEAQVKGADSNSMLHQALQIQMEPLKTLVLPLSDIQKQLPSISQLESVRDQTCVQEMKRLFAKVEEMKAQRVMLITQLREALQSDDVTKRLTALGVTKGNDLKEFFQQELAKHERHIMLIDQNLSAQHNVLTALTEANARYADTRKATSDLVRVKDARINTLLQAFHAYKDLSAKCQHGVDFYGKLEANVKKLLTRLKSVITVNRESREADLRIHTKTPATVPPENTNMAPNPGSSGPKLKDYLPAMKAGLKPSDISMQSSLTANYNTSQLDMEHSSASMRSEPGLRPTPLGAEQTLQPDHYRPTAGPTYSQYMPQRPYYPPDYAQYGYGSSYFHTAIQNPSINVWANHTGQTQTTVTPSSVAPPSLPTTSSSNQPYPYYNHPQSNGAPVTTATSTSSGNSLTATLTTDTTTYPQAQYYSQYPTNASANQTNQTPAHYPPHYQYPQVLTNPPANTTSTQVPQYPGPYNDYPTASTPLNSAGSDGYHYSPALDLKMSSNYQYPVTTNTTTVSTTIPTTTQSYYPYPNTQTPYASYPGDYYYNYHVTSSTPNPYAYASVAATPTTWSAQTYSADYLPFAYPQFQYPAPTVGTPVSNTHPLPATVHTPSNTGPIMSPQLNQVSQTNSPTTAKPPLVPQPPCQPKPASNVDLLTELLNPALDDKVLTPQPLKPSIPIPTPASTLAATASLPAAAITAVVTPPVISKTEPVPVKETVTVPQLPVIEEDRLVNPEMLLRFTQEVDKLDKLVEGLIRKSLNGPTPLDLKWRELAELENSTQKASISVARCYPMKNRSTDILPYDHNRVELPTTKDDYINASKIHAGGPDFIVTQCPLACTVLDFWIMFWEQQTEILVCLLSTPELQSMGGLVYWPDEKETPVEIGPYVITLQSKQCRSMWTERILSIGHRDHGKVTRVGLHLQFTAWPTTGFPANPSAFAAFVQEALQHWRQQRVLQRSLVVHCLAGAGRSGLFCLLCGAFRELNLNGNVPDLVRLAGLLSQQRRHLMKEREFLAFAYKALLLRAQDILLQKGVLSTTSSGIKPKSHHVRQASQDSIASIASLEDTPVTGTAVAAILDPKNFSLGSPQHTSRSSSSQSTIGLSQIDPNDPLNQLDPFWTMKK